MFGLIVVPMKSIVVVALHTYMLKCGLIKKAIFMVVKVFFLGRSGSGKSAAIRYMTAQAAKQGWQTKSFNDYNVLRRLYANDYEHTMFHHEHNDDHVLSASAVSDMLVTLDVVDPIVLTHALIMLEEEVSGFECSLHDAKHEQKQLITIEFARDDYWKNLNIFTRSFLEQAHYFFIASDLQTCFRRVKKRNENPGTKDDYFLPESVLLRDHSLQYMPPSIYGRKVHIIDNTKEDSLEQFYTELERVVPVDYLISS